MAVLLLGLVASPHADPLFSAPFLSCDVGSIPYSVCVADFNADLKPDLAVANAGSHTVSVLLGNGDGTFGTRTDFATGSWPRSVATADLNRDGRPDLAVANQGSNTVSVLLGNGDGTFGIRTDFEVGSDPWSVAIGDLDGDRRPDLAVANSAQSDATGSVSVLLGNGDGTFEARTDLSVGNHPWAVAIGDLDSDRRPDLVVANQGSNTLSVLLGNGDGSFDPGADISAGVDPLSVAIADLDGDGRPDLAVANSGLFHSNQPGTVSVLLGDGHGTFGSRTDYGTGLNPWSVAVADFNADGRRDLVVANQDPHTVSVLLGNGDGTFRDKLDSGTGSEPLSVAVADLDRSPAPHAPGHVEQQPPARTEPSAQHAPGRVDSGAAAETDDRDVIPWLRRLGVRPRDARRAAELCESIPNASLEERVRFALSHLAPPHRRVPAASPV
jgi:hypothetical protein